jgi:hypothetical protein
MTQRDHCWPFLTAYQIFNNEHQVGAAECFITPAFEVKTAEAEHP